MQNTLPPTGPPSNWICGNGVTHSGPCNCAAGPGGPGPKLARLLVALVATAAGLLFGVGGVAVAAAAEHPPARAVAAAAEPGGTCSCGAPAVDSGLCADCIDAPNEVHPACGLRHMQPYPGGTCPSP